MYIYTYSLIVVESNKMNKSCGKFGKGRPAAEQTSKHTPPLFTGTCRAAKLEGHSQPIRSEA